MGNLIEIKGLGAAVQSAKKGIADVRAETAGLQSDASALVSALQDVRQQIRQAQSDLQFEAETLGNGSPNSAPSSASAAPSSAPLATTAHATISPETHTRISDGSVILK